MISEILLSRNNAVIGNWESLDHLTRTYGVTDANGDGTITYRDAYATQMKTVSGIERAQPALSGYIRGVHTGDIGLKQRALENTAKLENHIIPRIIGTPGSIDPTLELE